MQIRPLTASDWETYRTIRLEALELAPEAFGADLTESLRFTSEEWSERITPGPNRIFLGAFQGDQIVGTAGLFREPRTKERHKATIVGVYVAPQARGQGAARVLMQGLLAHARTMPGLEQIHLRVVVGNVAARTLYERLGFVAYGREPRALQVGGRYLDEDLMCLRLTADDPT